MQKRNSYLIGKAFKNYLTASVLTVAATQVANIADMNRLNVYKTLGVIPYSKCASLTEFSPINEVASASSMWIITGKFSSIVAYDAVDGFVKVVKISK